MQGIEQLRDGLEELPDEIKAALRRAVREAAEAMRDDVQATVRKDTGNLHDSVAIRYSDEDLRAEIGWRDRNDRYATYHEFGTSRIPARPALGPAAAAERQRIVGRIRELIRQATL